ncbi:MAG: amidohydrolase family protein [Phycisphaerae bacterium]
MAAIDIHTHAFPDSLAGRAIEKLQAAGDWQAVGDGTVDGLVASMDAADIDISVLCPIATKPDQVRGILKWCKQIHSERIIPLGSVHPRMKKPEKWVAKFAAADLPGIKLHPMYQDFIADEPLLDPIWAAAVEHDMLVTIHAGKDIAFDPEDDRASPRRLRAVLDRFPKLKLICTHMGGWQSWNEVQQHLIGSTALLETSFSLGMIDPAQAVRIIRDHGPEKVMFGTDWPWNDQAAELQKLELLDLSPRETRAVLLNNAARLLGL